MNGRLVLYWTSAPVAALPRCAHSRRVSYRIADLIVECGPAGAFGGNAPAWPAPQNGGRGSVQPGDRASDRHCERDADRNSPESARESWQRMSASASRFEHVERVRVDGPRGLRVAAEFASAGASTHFGCFVERAPTPPGGGDPRVRGALRDVGQIVSGGTGSGSVGGVGSGAGSGSGPGIGGVGEGGSGVSFGMGRVCPCRLLRKRGWLPLSDQILASARRGSSSRTTSDRAAAATRRAERMASSSVSYDTRAPLIPSTVTVQSAPRFTT